MPVFHVSLFCDAFVLLTHMERTRSQMALKDNLIKIRLRPCHLGMSGRRMALDESQLQRHGWRKSGGWLEMHCQVEGGVVRYKSGV